MNWIFRIAETIYDGKRLVLHIAHTDTDVCMLFRMEVPRQTWFITSPTMPAPSATQWVESYALRVESDYCPTAPWPGKAQIKELVQATIENDRGRVHQSEIHSRLGRMTRSNHAKL